MDKQNRLTKWEELEIGAHYEWVKGNNVQGEFVLVEINRKGKYIRLQAVGSSRIARNYSWQKRYRKCVREPESQSQARNGQ